MAPNLPRSYKAAVFESAGTPLVIKDVSLEQPKQGQVLIKVLATGVCHSDAAVGGGHMGNSFPRIPGHETIGDVVAVGPGETVWKVGDRVGAPWHGGHDGNCKQCKRGQYQLCQNEAINGVTQDGGYAEYCLLRTEAVVRIPEDVDPAAFAPLLCAGVTVFNSIRRMNIIAGDTVAIQGLGGLGHLAIQYAAKMGYRVVALSSSGSKEKFAKDLGAHDYVDGSKEDAASALMKIGGAALVVATAPNPEAMASLVGGLAPGGKLLVLSPSGDIRVSTTALIMKAASVHGWPSGAALDSEEAISFAQIHDVNCMIEKFPLDDAQKALEHMLSGNVRFRCVLVNK
ncbi:MAG: hypothetical protein M1812_005462 [Candelaria pacifica]|nr:MAG: hypothetical protein M1812_005462 [Candelaria pacifica]